MTITMMGRPREAFDGRTRNRRIPAYWVSEGEEARWRAVLAPIIDGKSTSSVMRMNRLLDIQDAARELTERINGHNVDYMPDDVMTTVAALEALLRTDA